MDQQYWKALAAGDRREALAAIKRLRAEGVPTLEIVTDHLLVAQRRVGDLWASGEWSVAEEHRATSLNEGLLLWLGSFTTAPPPSSPAVVLACVEAERHALAALVVGEVLMAEGVRVDYLGAAPDPDELLARVAAQRPRAVLLSASLTSSLARAGEMVRRLREQGQHVVVGGQAFGDDERRALAIGATGWCPNPQEAADLVRALPGARDPVVPGEPSPAHEEARWLESMREQVVAYVVMGLRRTGAGPGRDHPAWDGDLEGWVDHLVGCLSATLVTGDETIMAEAGDWLVHVLGARGIDAGLVSAVLDLLREPIRSRPLATAQLTSTLGLLAAAEETSREDAARAVVDEVAAELPGAGLPGEPLADA